MLSIEWLIDQISPNEGVKNDEWQTRTDKIRNENITNGGT